MKPSLAEAKKVKAIEEMAIAYAALKAQMDRIEAKLDALLEPQKAAPKKATAEK